MLRAATQSRRRFLATSLVTLAAAPLGILACSDLKPSTTAAAGSPTTKDNRAMQQTPISLPVEGALPSFVGATGWLNSPPLTPDGLRGKVVRVEFLTYTCINWLRTMPYVRAWSETYRDHGLVVVGVHTPEFPFEKDAENVRRAMRDMRIEFPIAIDSDYGVWQAFKNNYWPALYFVDAMGQIRHHQYGEGDYERSEMILQQLLAEAGHGGFDRSTTPIEGLGAEAAADWDSLETPETYVGYRRGERLASPGGAASGRSHGYSVPARLGLNQWALAGEWTVDNGSATLNEPGGRIAYRFHARDLHLVMGPATRGASVRFRVLIDGQVPGEAHGADVDEQGIGTVSEQRLYQLIRQPAPIADGKFEIEFLDPGVEAFAFTFG
jgi:Thioredoxin like C-terminal domain/AhpC/TSA family